MPKTAELRTFESIRLLGLIAEFGMLSAEAKNRNREYYF
jgi:hypothetical protein